jgi:hypothetical protein
MAKKKPEPESHLIDGIEHESQEITPEPQLDPEWVTNLQGHVIRLSNDNEAIKKRVDAMAAIIWQNYGKVV